MGSLMPAEKRTRRLPSDSTRRQYESETERQASIARQAEIREAVLAYQALCAHHEVNVDDHSALDRWWASVSRREKQKLAGAIRREKKRAKEWLAKHEAELPQEGDGRDSTNIQPYKYFHRHDTRDLGVDDNLNDQDGVDFAQQSDILEPSEHKDTGTMRDEEAARVYLGLTTTLDKITESFGETSRTSLVSSGTLRSSWSRIEKALGNYYDSNGKRKQWRGERQVPPLHVYRQVSKMAYDETTGQFYPVTFAEFNPYDAEALESMRRRIGNKSKLHQPGFGDTNEMMPGRPLSYPTGPVRDWSGDKNDGGYRMWLQSGNYEGLVAFRKSLTKS